MAAEPPGLRRLPKYLIMLVAAPAEASFNLKDTQRRFPRGMLSSRNSTHLSGQSEMSGHGLYNDTRIAPPSLLHSTDHIAGKNDLLEIFEILGERHR